MTIEVYAPLAVCALLAVLSPWMSTRLPPRSGTWILAVAGATGGLCTVWALLLLTLSLIDDVPGLTRGGRFDLPVPDELSVVAAIVLAVMGGRIALHLHRRRQLRRALRSILDLPGNGLVVLPDAAALAYAVPGWRGRPGRIVATDAMVRALTPEQRRVLLAHERAHLDAAHSTALGLAFLGAAANPMLRPTARAVEFLSERCADERAATVVGDRELAAQALATAALATRPRRGSTPLPCFHDLGVVERVAALSHPMRPSRRLGLAVALGGAVVAVGAAVLATGEFARLVEVLLHGV